MFNVIARYLKAKSNRFLVGFAIVAHVVIWSVFYLSVPDIFWVPGLLFSLIIMGMAGEVHSEAKNANIFFVLAFTSMVMCLLVLVVSLFLVATAS